MLMFSTSAATFLVYLSWSLLSFFKTEIIAWTAEAVDETYALGNEVRVPL